jgi:hypothetical protein
MDRFFWRLKCHVSWKSAQWESICSMRTDRHMQPLVYFRSFANAPKIRLLCSMSSGLIFKGSRENDAPWYSHRSNGLWLVTSCFWNSPSVLVYRLGWERRTPIGLYKKLCEPWFRGLPMSSSGLYIPCKFWVLHLLCINFRTSSSFLLFKLNAHTMLNTYIYHQLPPTCFAVYYTIFREIFSALLRRLCYGMFCMPCICV